MDWTRVIIEFIGFAAVMVSTCVPLYVKHGKHSRSHDQIKKDIDFLKLEVTRDRLLTMLRYDKHNAVGIEEAMDRYLKLGGNGYVKREYEKWREWYDKKHPE